MPTYDYVCDACGHAFEHFQSMTSRVKRTCPECKTKKLRRLIGSGAGVIFKGSGFYETDYKRKSRGPSKSADEGSSESSTNSGSGKSSTTSEKPAEKPTKKDGNAASGKDSKSSGKSDA